MAIFANLGIASAAVRLPRLVGDKMVLQRDTELKIWGWANPGEKITIHFKDQYYNGQADKQGDWSVMLPAQKAGGPYIMEVNEIIIRDILVGDVWLASGQSNMETPIIRLVDRFPEVNVSNYNMIRYFKVPTQDLKESLKDDIADGGKWYSGTASEVMNWTALAYFYAVEAYKHTNIPVGMLVSSKGGTAIESWVKQEDLKQFPQLIVDKNALEGLKLAKKDKGDAKWYLTDWNDSDWKTVDVPFRWKSAGLNTKGTIWFRKNIELPASMDGKFAKLYMGVMIDSDSIFVNGHFVGSTSYTYPPRKYNIPAGILREGKNIITVKLTSNSGNGGFVDDKPYKIVCENQVVDLSGIWKYKVGNDIEEVKEFEGRLENLNNVGSGLYNGMIYPLRNYKVRGAIWYQGESNAGHPQNYATLLESLIVDWRKLWNMTNMPFLLVQLPNFMEKSEYPSESGWARIREAELKTALKIPNTALAVTYDLGEWNDIHPLNKKDVAKRLFLGTRKVVYGEKIISSGPIYKNMIIEGDKIILTFTETGSGLTSKKGSLKHFAIAGEDKKFVWADAVVKGNKVIVTSKLIKKPVAVRYAWSNNPEDANFQNKEGLLASPFRTDNW